MARTERHPLFMQSCMIGQRLTPFQSIPFDIVRFWQNSSHTCELGDACIQSACLFVTANSSCTGYLQVVWSKRVDQEGYCLRDV